MEIPIQNKLVSLRSALGYSAIESIGSRVFDLITLWIVLNTLPAVDLAKFGLATSALIFFNLVFVAPETALLRYQKEWAKTGRLIEAISSYLSFSIAKLALHFLIAAGAYWYFNGLHWFVYAVVFSAITQQIQFAEIVRIYLRMDLQQNRVARFELLSKLILCILALALFKFSSLACYFGIYFAWSAIVALSWLLQLSKNIKLQSVSVKTACSRIIESMLGFSFWSHISGVLTFYIYNSNILFLEAASAPVKDIALYTSISKVSNLFFVIPMFFQSFVPVVLANSGSNEYNKFKKVLLANGLLSGGQFVFFVAFGLYLAPLFGVKDTQAAHDFYFLGIIISAGILFLNLSRPLGSYLQLKVSPHRTMVLAIVPSALLATVLYSVGASQAGVYGCAIGSALAYAFMAAMFWFLYDKNNKAGQLNAETAT